MEKIRVNYTDNTKEGMKKKRRENILKKLEPMSSVIQDRIIDLELQMADIQLDLDYIDNVYHSSLVICVIAHVCLFMFVKSSHWNITSAVDTTL